MKVDGIIIHPEVGDTVERSYSCGSSCCGGDIIINHQITRIDYARGKIKLLDIQCDRLCGVYWTVEVSMDVLRDTEAR